MHILFSLSALGLAGDADPKIVNGQTEEGFPSVVAIGADFGGSVYSACTGNLITPRVVLTAGHCGADLDPEIIVALGQAYFGETADTAELVVGLEDYRLHPEYEPLGEASGIPGAQDLGQYDVSLLVLDEDVTTIEPIWFRRDALTEDDVGLEMTSVGFGITGSSASDSGVKRSAVLTLDEYDDMYALTYSSSNDNSANICSGDSGGPQFYVYDSGRIEQWGVHSWGDQACTQVGASTRTDVAADWILDEIEDIHGSRDVCEINGWYDDGVCDEYCDGEDPDCMSSEEVDDEEDAAVACGCAASSPVSGSATFGLLLGLMLVRRRS